MSEFGSKDWFTEEQNIAWMMRAILVAHSPSMTKFEKREWLNACLDDRKDEVLEYADFELARPYAKKIKKLVNQGQDYDLFVEMWQRVCGENEITTGSDEFVHALATIANREFFKEDRQ